MQPFAGQELDFSGVASTLVAKAGLRGPKSMDEVLILLKRVVVKIKDPFRVSKMSCAI